MPELVKYEVGNVLLEGEQLTHKLVNSVLETFYAIPLTFMSDDEAIAKLTFQIALESKVTYYDATFMALAKEFDALSITDNIEHQGKMTDLNVIALEDY